MMQSPWELILTAPWWSPSTSAEFSWWLRPSFYCTRPEYLADGLPHHGYQHGVRFLHSDDGEGVYCSLRCCWLCSWRTGCHQRTALECTPEHPLEPGCLESCPCLPHSNVRIITLIIQRTLRFLSPWKHVKRQQTVTLARKRSDSFWDPVYLWIRVRCPGWIIISAFKSQRSC